MTILFYW